MQPSVVRSSFALLAVPLQAPPECHNLESGRQKLRYLYVCASLQSSQSSTRANTHIIIATNIHIELVNNARLLTVSALSSVSSTDATPMPISSKAAQVTTF
jgi:hypothetical protein